MEALSEVAWKALKFLTDYNEMINIKRLSEMINVSYQSLTGKNNLYWLVNNGLVKTNKDGTSKLVEITKKGKEFVKANKTSYNHFYGK